MNHNEDACEPQLSTTADEPFEFDLRDVMMKRIEEAADQSPWVPAEYSMSEVISDCCTFLRAPRQPAPDDLELLLKIAKDQVKAAKLVEALQMIDALDPEAVHIRACSESAIRGLVLRMGEIARTVLKEVQPHNTQVEEEENEHVR